MSKSRHPMNNKLRKKLSKEIRSAQSQFAIPETKATSDKLTTKEMLKQYPNRKARKLSEILPAVEKKFALDKKKHQKHTSKRTAPGTVPSDSTPADAHREGTRWMKATKSKILNQRAIQAHRGKGKK